MVTANARTLPVLMYSTVEATQHYLHLSTYEVGERGLSAAIGDMYKVDACAMT